MELLWCQLFIQSMVAFYDMYVEVLEFRWRIEEWNCSSSPDSVSIKKIWYSIAYSYEIRKWIRPIYDQSASSYEIWNIPAWCSLWTNSDWYEMFELNECENVKTKMKNRNMKIRYFQIETGPIIWRSLISRCWRSRRFMLKSSIITRST